MSYLYNFLKERATGYSKQEEKENDIISGDGSPVSQESVMCTMPINWAVVSIWPGTQYAADILWRKRNIIHLSQLPSVTRTVHNSEDNINWSLKFCCMLTQQKDIVQSFLIVLQFYPHSHSVLPTSNQSHRSLKIYQSAVFMSSLNLCVFPWFVFQSCSIAATASVLEL